VRVRQRRDEAGTCIVEVGAICKRQAALEGFLCGASSAARTTCQDFIGFPRAKDDIGHGLASISRDGR
jgi:hypothetical protein